MIQSTHAPRHDAILDMLVDDRLADATDARDLGALEWERLDVPAGRCFDAEATALTESARRIWLESRGASPVDVYNAVVRDRARLIPRAA